MNIELATSKKVTVNSIANEIADILTEYKDDIDDLVVDIISKENSRIDSKIHQDFFRERLNYYLNEREPYDFYYLGKKTIDKVTEEVRSKSK